MIALGLLAWSGGYIGSRGGFRAILRSVMGSYPLTVEAYQREGLKKCYMKGNLRYPSGEIVEGKWLIVGAEGKDVAIYDGEKVIHIPKDGTFLKARLKVADEEKWQMVTINEPVEITRVDSGDIVFFRCGIKWGQADQGDMVMGYILYSGDVRFVIWPITIEISCPKTLLCLRVRCSDLLAVWSAVTQPTFCNWY